jgi:DNA-binding response OmpR family regulator
VKGSSQRGYILVVESDDLVRELLKRWLGEAGYTVVIGNSVDFASLAGLRLVIANIASPRRVEVSIRGLKSVYPAPILAISARFRRGLEGSSEAARRLGVNHVLPKPFTRKELLSAVRDSIGDTA